MNLRPAKCDEMASLRCINLKLPMSESGIRPYVGFDRVWTLRPYKPAHSAEIPCGTFVCSLASHAAAFAPSKGRPASKQPHRHRARNKACPAENLHAGARAMSALSGCRHFSVFFLDCDNPVGSSSCASAKGCRSSWPSARPSWLVAAS